MNCCEKPFLECNRQVYSCMDTLLVTIPPSYVGETISVQIFNGKSVKLYEDLVITANAVELDLTETNNFLNPYGALFELTYLDESGKAVPFTGPDGNQYNEIAFVVSQASRTEGIIDIWNLLENSY